MTSACSKSNSLSMSKDQMKNNCSSIHPKQMLLVHKDHPSNFSSIHTLCEFPSWPWLCVMSRPLKTELVADGCRRLRAFQAKLKCQNRYHLHHLSQVQSLAALYIFRMHSGLVEELHLVWLQVIQYAGLIPARSFSQAQQKGISGCTPGCCSM
ncbi:hypothetical protein PVAP13_3KG491603 [Panicum virgatum]|uniref:Uncharacterized protein n=2 Tax=Panicum virgatum TaxID=38727 RepID=A0A8T0V9A0_PANVG|nr:hypothetical protein PVAP13_3KG491603 [Panicum virgatum]